MALSFFFFLLLLDSYQKPEFIQDGSNKKIQRGPSKLAQRARGPGFTYIAPLFEPCLVGLGDPQHHKGLSSTAPQLENQTECPSYVGSCQGEYQRCGVQVLDVCLGDQLSKPLKTKDLKVLFVEEGHFYYL